MNRVNRGLSVKRKNRIRIAYGRISQETHAFSPVETTMKDFQDQHFLEGAELEAACSFLKNEAPGWTPLAELSGFILAARRWFRKVEPVPLFSAWALPAGPLSEETFQALRERLKESLRRAGPVDGVFLSMHGAMRARGSVAEPEEDFLAAVREVVGPEVPVAITLDLHAQLTPHLVNRATILAGYRTNPHRDLPQVGYRAGKLLIRTVLGQVKPVVGWRALPMVMGGGKTIDLLPPMRAIFRRMKEMERDPRVLLTSLFMCHLWNDSPDLGWSVHVITDNDRALADTLADELAEKAWAVRHERPPPFLSTEEVLDQIRRSRIRHVPGTFCLTDTSDVVGAGSTGENTSIVKALLEHGQGLTGYVPVRDAGAVDSLWDMPLGSEVGLKVGGKIDPEMNPPVEVSGRLLSRKPTEPSGRKVALDLGHVKLVVTDGAAFNMKPSFFSDLGLNPWRADYVVVKSLFHFRVFYLALNRRSFLVRTQGITDLDVVGKIRFNDPVHPFHEVQDWRPVDRKRRGVL